MKILTVFMMLLTVLLVLFTIDLFSVLRIQDFIMLVLMCITSLIGCLCIGVIALNSEE
jgi:hypothetical protein